MVRTLRALGRVARGLPLQHRWHSTAHRHPDGSADCSADLSNACASKTAISDPSLTLDLGAAIQIAYVTVYNRAFCCKERLAHYTISYRATLTDAWTVCSIGDAAADALGPLLSECSGLAQYVMVHSPQLVSIL